MWHRALSLSSGSGEGRDSCALQVFLWSPHFLVCSPGRLSYDCCRVGVLLVLMQLLLARVVTLTLGPLGSWHMVRLGGRRVRTRDSCYAIAPCLRLWCRLLNESRTRHTLTLRLAVSSRRAEIWVNLVIRRMLTFLASLIKLLYGITLNSHYVQFEVFLVCGPLFWRLCCGKNKIV